MVRLSDFDGADKRRCGSFPQLRANVLPNLALDPTELGKD